MWNEITSLLPLSSSQTSSICFCCHVTQNYFFRFEQRQTQAAESGVRTTDNSRCVRNCGITASRYFKFRAPPQPSFCDRRTSKCDVGLRGLCLHVGKCRHRFPPGKNKHRSAPFIRWLKKFLRLKTVNCIRRQLKCWPTDKSTSRRLQRWIGGDWTSMGAARRGRGWTCAHWLFFLLFRRYMNACWSTYGCQGVFFWDRCRKSTVRLITFEMHRSRQFQKESSFFSADVA